MTPAKTLAEQSPLYAPASPLLDRAVARRLNGVFIDAGANVGGFIKTARDMEVHAFEPVPEPFSQLVKDYGKRPRTVLNNVGLSSESEILRNVTVANCWTIGDPAALGLDVSIEYATRPRFNVALTTLDDYARDHGLAVDVLKLDVDGYEHRVLRGARTTLLRDRPFIFAELSYLVRNVADPASRADAIPAFVSFILDDLNYAFASNDGSLVTRDRSLILTHYPYHTSFDVCLLPAENLATWL